MGFWNKKAEAIEDGSETSPAQSLDRDFQTGLVDGFFDEKGYGFIKPDKPGQNVFFHESHYTIYPVFVLQPSGYTPLAQVNLSAQ